MSEKIDVLDREGFINKLSLLVKMLSDKKMGERVEVCNATIEGCSLNELIKIFCTLN